LASPECVRDWQNQNVARVDPAFALCAIERAQARLDAAAEKQVDGGSSAARHYSP
jgi:polysaccharide pyruvyl transferase WcaK-like protein